MLWRNDYDEFPFLHPDVCQMGKETCLFFSLPYYQSPLITLNIVGNAYFDILLQENKIAPRLERHYFVTTDNSILPFRAWVPDKRPTKAVIVALHGINDYSNFFTAPEITSPILA